MRGERQDSETLWEREDSRKNEVEVRSKQETPGLREKGKHDGGRGQAEVEARSRGKGRTQGEGNGRGKTRSRRGRGERERTQRQGGGRREDEESSLRRVEARETGLRA